MKVLQEQLQLLARQRFVGATCRPGRAEWELEAVT
ncbi:hypothetical protein GZL_01209 [Streptomyces sp. 769]|nr:hypothetical protein GZL_01209 [Streptomyces sp. 769]